MDLVRCLFAAVICVCTAYPISAAGQTCDGQTVYRSEATGTRPDYRVVEGWIARWGAAADTVVMGPAGIGRLNQANGTRAGAFQDVVLGPSRSEASVDGELDDRLRFMLGKVLARDWFESFSGMLRVAKERAVGARRVNDLHAIVHPSDLRCLPSEHGLYTAAMDPDFDRNQCSRLHPGEIVRVSRVSRDGRWFYVHTGHAVGWLEEPALTPVLSREQAESFRDRGRRLVTTGDWVMTASGMGLRMGISLPHLGLTEDGLFHHVLAPSEAGIVDDFVAVGPEVRLGYSAMSRRALLRTVFPRLGDAYGWGGTSGGRDCSRLMRDTFATFGLQLGRHSGVQARSGRQVIDVSGLSDADKHGAIVRAGRRGIVFLYMSGHIMLYLGEAEGQSWAISAIGEYLEPCPEGGHRTVRLDRVEVTNLELGRGTERTSFIERIKTLAVFAP